MKELSYIIHLKGNYNLPYQEESVSVGLTHPLLVISHVDRKRIALREKKACSAENQQARQSQKG